MSVTMSMRQEGCDSPLSAWDRELNQTERIKACDALRAYWEELLAKHGTKSPAVIEWEELKRSNSNSLGIECTDEEVKDILGPTCQEKMEIFFGEGLNYSLPLKFQDAPARLHAIGYPLETALFILVIDKHHPFQVHDLATEAKPAFIVGPVGSGEALAGSIEKTGMEAGINAGFADFMTTENIRALFKAFQNGGFTVDVKPSMKPNVEAEAPRKPAPVTGLRGIVLSFANRFAGKAA